MNGKAALRGCRSNKAAACVRMSTDQQDQPIALQLDFIARYAAAAECQCRLAATGGAVT